LIKIDGYNTKPEKEYEIKGGGFMKKIFSVILIVVCVFSLFSCSELTRRGIDEFSVGNSDFSLCSWLIPKDFLKTYDNYVDGDYFFYEQAEELFSYALIVDSEYFGILIYDAELDLYVVQVDGTDIFITFE
jgi:hypothetical protein